MTTPYAGAMGEGKAKVRMNSVDLATLLGYVDKAYSALAAPVLMLRPEGPLADRAIDMARAPPTKISRQPTFFGKRARAQFVWSSGDAARADNERSCQT